MGLCGAGGGCGAPLSSAVPAQGLMCPEHKEEVTHYCKTCQRLVCQLCRVRRTHTSHKITPVLSAYQALRVRAAGAGLGPCGELGAPQSPGANGGCGARAAGTTSHHLPAGEADKEPRLHPEQPGHGADPDCRAGGDSEAHGGKGRGRLSVPELCLGRGDTASPVPSGPRTCHTLTLPCPCPAGERLTGQGRGVTADPGALCHAGGEAGHPAAGHRGVPAGAAGQPARPDPGAPGHAGELGHGGLCPGGAEGD